MAVVPFGTPVRSTKPSQVFHEEAQRVIASKAARVYESHELSIVSPSTNQPLTTFNHVASCSCVRGALSASGLIARAARVTIRNVGTKPITIRFNDTAEDPVTLDDGERLDWDFLEITEIYFSNTTGVAIPLRITLT